MQNPNYQGLASPILEAPLILPKKKKVARFTVDQFDIDDNENVKDEILEENGSLGDLEAPSGVKSKKFVKEKDGYNNRHSAQMLSSV